MGLEVDGSLLCSWLLPMALLNGPLIKLIAFSAPHRPVDSNACITEPWEKANACDTMNLCVCVCAFTLCCATEATAF
jgi:hypothetical protein